MSAPRGRRSPRPPGPTSAPGVPAEDELVVIDGGRDAELGDDDLVRGARLRDAVVVGDKIADLEITTSHLTAARLTGAEMDRLVMRDVVIEDSELSGVLLNDATFLRVVFRRCRMTGFVAPMLKAEDVLIDDCRMDDSMLRMATLARCAFRSCDLTRADFYGARITDSRMTGSTLTGASFSTASLDRVELHGSRLDDLQGADSLRGAVIGSDQAPTLVYPLLHALGIVVDDDPTPGER